MSLYQFSSETLTQLKKFRIASARRDTLSCQIYAIAKETYEIIQEEPEDEITSMEELQEELPDNTPRFVVLSYPTTTKDGRKVSPLVMLYWLPYTAAQDQAMLYAGALELMRDNAGVSKCLEVRDEEEFEELEIV